MVGVPGRSKGCLTCRKRRKGCDTQRPSCGQCRRLGLECAGYSRDLVWVNTMERGASYRAQSITLSDKLTQSAYESRYLGFFWSSYLPNGQALLSDAAQDSLGGWSNTIQALYPSSNILKKTLLALCLTSTGRLDGNKWMVQQGLGMYVGAMQDMSVALRKPSSALSDAILTTAKLFSLYEAMCGTNEEELLTQPESWVAHCEGELSILEARGPEKYMHGHSHRLFVDGRSHLAITALQARKKSILSDPKWKTTPWTYHEKTPKDQLLDILVDIPGLLEQSDIFQSCTEPNVRNKYRHKLLYDCSKYLMEFTDWISRFPQPEEPKQLDRESSAPVHIQDLASEHLKTLYWTTGIFLHRIMHIATDSETDVHLTYIKDYCRRIIRAVPVFFHPSVGKFRSHLAPFPTIVVALHLPIFAPAEREAKQELLDKCLMTPEGAAIGSFLAAWKKPLAAQYLL